MKTRTVIVLAALALVVVVIGAVVEWRFVSWMGASGAVHNYHGICNVGVGQPYQGFIHQLRTIAESGDTNRLVSVLRRADERSRDIYDVWLGDSLPEYHRAYRKSIDEILKEMAWLFAALDREQPVQFVSMGSLLAAASGQWDSSLNSVKGIRPFVGFWVLAACAALAGCAGHRLEAGKQWWPTSGELRTRLASLQAGMTVNEVNKVLGVTLLEGPIVSLAAPVTYEFPGPYRPRNPAERPDYDLSVVFDRMV
jgi:hypothetical protein